MIINTEANRNTIITLWNTVNRTGIADLVTFLNKSDFFEAPCSTQFHLAQRGGLAQHSINVYNLLIEKVERFKLDVADETIIICGLGHDLCKIGIYKEGGDLAQGGQLNWCRDLLMQRVNYLSDEDRSKLAQMKYITITPGGYEVSQKIPKEHASILIDWLKNRPKEPMPDLPVKYSVEDSFPFGHGEKSVSILQNYIPLTDEEKLAIRWHMAAYDASIHFNYPNGFAYQKALEMSPLVTLLFTADYEASQIIEAVLHH